MALIENVGDNHQSYYNPSASGTQDMGTPMGR